MDHERRKQQPEQDKLELEKAKIEMEYFKLKLLQESKMNNDSLVESGACGLNFLLTRRTIAAVWQTREEASVARFTNATSQYSRIF